MCLETRLDFSESNCETVKTMIQIQWLWWQSRYSKSIPSGSCVVKSQCGLLITLTFSPQPKYNHSCHRSVSVHMTCSGKCWGRKSTCVDLLHDIAWNGLRGSVLWCSGRHCWTFLQISSAAECPLYHNIPRWLGLLQTWCPKYLSTYIYSKKN